MKYGHLGFGRYYFDMPRRARIDAAGALHHIIMRGIERSEIFRDDHDKDVFIDRLGDILLDTRTRCLAWVLMSNMFTCCYRPGKYIEEQV